MEFKRSTDRDEGFLEVKGAEANEQHKSIIGELKAATPKGELQNNFVVGNRGSVVQSDLYTKLKKLDVQEGKKDKLFADHVTQVCEAHNRVIVSYLSRCKEARGQPQRDRGRMNGRRESNRRDRRTPLRTMHMTTELFFFLNIRLDVAGFSGLAGPIPFVHS